MSTTQEYPQPQRPRDEYETPAAPREKPRRGSTLGSLLVAAVVAAVVATGITVPVVRGVADSDASPAPAAATAGEAATVQTANADEPADAGGSDTATSSVEEIAEAVLPSVVRIDVGQGSGSGVIYRDDGYIITNAHVVGDAPQVNVTLASGEEVAGEVVGTADFTDIAIVRVTTDQDLPTVPFAEATPDVGSLTVAIGSPFGLDATVTSGVVSGLDRELAAGTTVLTGLIQTDAAINPGNSGGALVGEDGQIIGINTAILSGSGTSSGVGFAIPSTTVIPLADQLIESGEIVPGFMGIEGETVTAEASETFGVPQGAIVVRVLDGSPAADAGLQPQDIITAVNGEQIETMIELSGRIQLMQPGETVELTIVRGGEEQTVEVTLGERPQQPPTSP